MTVFRLLLIIILLLILPQVSFAQSSYVLPYPSTMPGGLAYKLRLVYDAISKYWYFGSFGQFDYNLKLADKYLVEAKTLFEYRQYLLAHNALRKSDFYFKKLMFSLEKASGEGKDVSQKRATLRNAAQKHIDIIEEIEVPEVFIWQPEKAPSTRLDLKKSSSNSISVRKNNL
ncbi:MAG: hypothetical protein Q8P26_04795 [Candidatus Levybacteria bacterium]|nr:hypothetical protein [Candidatus Levybacteria bacterium]